jgi:hypothetical protein
MAASYRPLLCGVQGFQESGLTEPKPSHLSTEYGAWFKDALLAAAYPARPAYPDGVMLLLETH